jgi:hypothetical protein
MEREKNHSFNQLFYYGKTKRKSRYLWDMVSSIFRRSILLSYFLTSFFYVFIFTQVYAQDKQECRGHENGTFVIRFKNIVDQYQKLQASEDIQKFEKMYPHSIKTCVVSQYAVKKNKPTEKSRYGSATGHYVNFLRGVCEDKDSPYPKLRLCRPEEISKESQGVGVSVNQPFYNAKFVVSSQDMFFSGGTKAEDILDENLYQTIQGRAEKLYEKVKFHHWFHMPPGHKNKKEREQLKRDLIGSDYGILINRYAYCMNIPLNEKLLQSIVDDFNETNRQAYRRKNYRWDFLKDNCVHMSANSFVRLGFSKDKYKPNQCYAKHVKHPLIPLNHLLEIIHTTYQEPIDPMKIFKNSYLRKMLLNYDWLPYTHDALTEIMNPINYKRNDLYEPTPYVYAFRRDWLNPYTKPGVKKTDLQSIFSEEVFTKLKENRSFFLERYQQALESLEKTNEELHRGKKILPVSLIAEWYKFSEVLKGFLNKQIEKIQHKE